MGADLYLFHLPIAWVGTWGQCSAPTSSHLPRQDSTEVLTSFSRSFPLHPQKIDSERELFCSAQQEGSLQGRCPGGEASVSSVAQSCLTFCNPMDCSTQGFSVHHQLLEITLTHVHPVSEVIQLSREFVTSSVLSCCNKNLK